MSDQQRRDRRLPDQLRAVRFEAGVLSHAPGSVLAHFGNTKVVCTATLEPGVPRFLWHSGKGWLTAEYGMLPGSTNKRSTREAVAGRQSGRTMEIQRLIGRSLRMSTDLARLGENTLRVDCDVIEADGGTRTAAISGACIAVSLALRQSVPDAFVGLVGSVSVGIRDGQALLDLDYEEDSSCDTDMNVVAMEQKGFIELQGTAERAPFSRAELIDAIELAEKGIREISCLQREALSR